MKNLALIIAVICIASACRFKSGSGNIITQERSTGNFTGVSAGGGFEVTIRKGNETKVVVEADDNIINDIKTTVNNGQLRISLTDGFNFNDVHMKVFITAPEINKIHSSASAEIEVTDQLNSDEKIELDASSGSNIKASLNAPAAEAEASSGAEITVTGRTKNFTAKATSGASVNASGLLSENTMADASSGGKAEVHASVDLNAKASSGGSVEYRGAAKVSKDESSGGSVEQHN